MTRTTDAGCSSTLPGIPAVSGITGAPRRTGRKANGLAMCVASLQTGDWRHRMGPTDNRTTHDGRPRGSAAADENARSAGQVRPGEERRILEDRRVRYDRREMIRFEDDRRTGFDRRTDADPWAMHQ